MCYLLKITPVVLRPSWVVVRATKDFFQHRYYRLGKILMSLIGQWPGQSTGAKWGILAFIIFFIAYHIIGQLLVVVKYRHDWNILLQCIVPAVFEGICATKYLHFLLTSQSSKKLLNGIRTNWRVWAHDRDVNILHEYAHQGQKICIMYTGITAFTIQPMITKLIDVALRNGTEPGTFSTPVYYYNLDMQKYYFYLIVYVTVCSCMIVTVTLSSDVNLILYVHHVTSIFAAVGHKLERLGCHDALVGTGEYPYAVIGKTDVEYVASCIDRHNDAIEYAGLIKASYAWNFFFSLGFGMLLINALGIQIVRRTNDIGSKLTFIVLGFDALLYLFVECCISQILTDHSIRIRVCILNSQWYRVSIKAQKLLILMTIRCNVPSQLTLGNMVIMSVQNFGMFVRTAASYFTCLRSVRGL